VSVTADDPRYDDWPSRKPGKTAKLAAKLRDRPVQLAAEEATKHIATTLRRKGRGSLGTALKTAVGGITLAGAGTVAASASILAAGYLVADTIARNERVKLGDRLNAISLRFAETQRRLEEAFGTTKWDGVPADVRAKAVRDYKSAIATATSRAQGQAFAGNRAEGSYK
jgi:hypothetical protein